MPPPFVILALPRSRTRWISTFLTYGPWHCGHDELRHCRSLDDVASWFAQPLTGTVETAAAPFWRLLGRYAPGARVVTVRRPVPDVVASLKATGVVPDHALVTQVMTRLDRKLDQIEARVPGVLSIRYEDLAKEATCARLFEHCLGMPHDPKWWAACDAVNLQVSVPYSMRYFMAHAAQVERLRRMARHEMLRGLRRPIELNGVSFQQEPLAQAFGDPDGQRLMSDECAGLGECPDAFAEMNIPLFERLEAIDRLHIFTARSNGRMFGYLVSALGEAFHGRGQCEAEQVSFYADPAWPGLGRKLQQASIEDLRARGVARVLMFAPDKTRVGLVYRRLGAKQTGQRFVLELR